jgi:hypothetical protein
MSSDDDTPRLLYERVCDSYHAVDDFRTKLLGLLPVATGTGVFVLLNGNAELLGEDDGQISEALLAIGIVGFLFTLGLFAYELFGIKKCHYLIMAGQQLEGEMRYPGQFRSRPRELAGFINEPYASAIIYPACMAAWLFLALSLISALAATLVAGVALFVGYKATRFGARRIKENQEVEDLVLEVLTERGELMRVDEVREAAGKKDREVAARRKKRVDQRPEPKGRLHRIAGWLDRAAARRKLTKPRQPDWVDRAVERLEERGDLKETKGGLQPTTDPVRRVDVSQVKAPSLGVAAADDS